MAAEDRTVSLDEFAKYLLKKWKWIAAAVVICTAFSVSFSIKNGQRIEAAPSEEYLFLKEQEADFEEYMEKSVIMQMNPMEIYETTIVAENLSDGETVGGLMDLPEFWEDWNEETETEYLAELITSELENDGKRLKIKVRHSEEASCRELTAYVEQKLKESDSEAEIQVSEPKTVKDESVSDSQMWYRNRLKDIRGQLEYAGAGYVIEVSRTLAAALGLMAGVLVSVVILFFSFMIHEKRIQNSEK